MNFSRLVAVYATVSAFSTLVQAGYDNNVAFNLASEAGYIDNFLYQARDEQSTAYYTLSSDLAFTSKTQQSAFNFDAKIASYSFNKFENDEHTDFTIAPTYQFKFSQNQRFYLSAHWLNDYTYRGTGLTLGEAETLSKGDKRQSVATGVGYEFGTLDSQGRLNVEVNYHESEFKTRRIITSRLDTEILSIKSSFDYLLSGKTYLAFDVDYKATEYPNAELTNRDSITGLVGIKWFTTVISELKFLVGYQNLNFEDSRLSDDSAFKWQFDYTWRPSNYTQVHIVSNRSFDESYRLISSYRLAQTHQINLEHAFTDYFKVYTAFGINNEKFITLNKVQKEDYIFSTLMLDYQHSDRLSIQLSYDYKSLDANIAASNYLYNSFALKVKVEL
tara:strand:- start:500 stop:1663 length:1164 start_codon:yes stop_codon:yes gene_type:complete